MSLFWHDICISHYVLLVFCNDPYIIFNLAPRHLFLGLFSIEFAILFGFIIIKGLAFIVVFLGFSIITTLTFLLLTI